MLCTDGEGVDRCSVPAESFDLVVSYLTLIDIPDLVRATAKMVDALRPGGTLLIANITSFTTAVMADDDTFDHTGRRRTGRSARTCSSFSRMV